MNWSIYWSISIRLIALFALLPLHSGCQKSDDDLVQGYVEGEYVYVAAPYGGTLREIQVQRGQSVEPGTELFALDSAPQQAAHDEAVRRLAQANATLDDLSKGSRPTEIESLKAQLEQARAALVRSEHSYARLERLKNQGAVSLDEFDMAQSTRNQDRARVSQLQADLKTSQLGAREDQIAAAQEAVKAQQAILAKADWDLLQMRKISLDAGLVFDTFFREGEWVAAGRPVVALLPPKNIKVRAFVPEARIGLVQVGDLVHVLVDGVEVWFEGKVSYISPQAEYTPPVIYSNQSRSKLVFMIEATFSPEIAQKLHPGQPVDVRLKESEHGD